MAQQIGEHIYKAYQELGYSLIEIPAVCVEERMEMIMGHIER
jgi:predicted ATPase